MKPGSFFPIMISGPWSYRPEYFLAHFLERMYIFGHHRQTGTGGSNLVGTPTPQPTSTPAPSREILNGGVPVYWNGFREVDLAQFQQNQGNSKDCGPYSIAAALNMLYGGGVSGQDVADIANQQINVLGLLWFSERPGLRGRQGRETSPNQIAAFFNGIARQTGWALRAETKRLTPGQLIDNLKDQNKLTIVVTMWDSGFRPWLARVSDASNQIPQVSKLAAHAMVLAAYDPNISNPNEPGGRYSEWGFVNSWTNAGSEIYWMPNEDLEKSLKYPLLRFSRNAVIVTKD